MLLRPHQQLLDELREDLARGAPRLDDAPELRVPVDRYLSPQRFEAERHLLRRTPLMVAHASEVASPGSCVRVDRLGTSAVVARGRDGELRAFLNACRHRATQLVAEPACQKKAFVCPYHGWTYDLTGSLIHVPHEAAFSGIDRASHRLVELPVTSAHGFVWLTLTAGGECDVGALLGSLGADLDALAFADHVVFRRTTTVCRANWKLLIEAFLENYHLRHLHRDTIYRFFLDGFGAFRSEGRHIRALSARRTLAEARGEPDLDTLRTLTSPSYYLFPNTILVVHPDYLSHLGIYPDAVDRLTCVHTMFIPPDRRDEHDYWERSFTLIDGGVFRAEDYEIVEKMHAGITTGANSHLTFGRLEQSIRHFHTVLDEALIDEH